MQVKAKLNYLRIAPRKVRLVADLVRGKSVEEAQNILRFLAKKASLPIFKLLNSALANAKNNFQLDGKNLYVSKIIVDEGPKLKRWLARSRGRADELQKKTSHITLVLDETEEGKKAVKEVLEAAAEKAEKAETAEKVEKIAKVPKAKFRPEADKVKPKKKTAGPKKVLRRTAF